MGLLRKRWRSASGCVVRVLEGVLVEVLLGVSAAVVVVTMACIFQARQEAFY